MAIGSIRFADGTVWDYTTVDLLTQATANFIWGTTGDDVLYGNSSSNNVFSGGLGDDDLIGGGNSDTYLFGLGDGQDWVDNYSINNSDPGDLDVIQFKSGVLPGDVVASHPGGNTLRLTIANFDDYIEVRNYFAYDGQSAFHLDLIRFADGTEWNYASVKQTILAPTSGDDDIGGFVGVDDVLTGGTGNDVLRGNGGKDTYVFNLGDAQDEVRNYVWGEPADDFDVLELNGISHDQLWFSQEGNDLVIDYVGTDDRVRLDNWYVSPNYQLDEIRTGLDGMTLLDDQVNQLVIAMAQFAIPQGVGATVPQDQQDQLASTLAAVWS